MRYKKTKARKEEVREGVWVLNVVVREGVTEKATFENSLELTEWVSKKYGHKRITVTKQKGEVSVAGVEGIWSVIWRI